MVLGGKQAINRFLLRAVDCGLAGAIFATPLAMGGRHAVGQLVLTVLAVAAAWGWAVRQCLRGDAGWRPIGAAMPLLLMGLLLVVLQTVPLPPSLRGRLAPATAELLPFWGPEAKTPVWFGDWPCISFAPAETLAGLVVFLDYILLFIVAAQRIHQIEDVERLLRWCALAAVGMASLGIVQLVTGNGKFLWLYEHPFSNPDGSATGSFSNRNHFAQSLALGIGPLIWWLQDTLRRTQGSRRQHRTESGTVRGEVTRHQGDSDTTVWLLGAGLGVVLLAGLLSLSRGGIAAMFLAATICTDVCCRTASLGRRFVAVLAGAGLLIVLSLAIFGYERVSHRLETVSSASLEKLDNAAARRTIWATTVRATGRHLLLGTGVGSFGEAYLAYADTPLESGKEPTHAENGYLQILLETGGIGLGLMLAGIAVCALWCVAGIRASSTRARLCAAAITSSLAASAAHSLVDFVWYVPACMAMVVILAACAKRIGQMAREKGKQQKEEIRRRQDCQFRVPDCAEATFSPRRFFWPAAAAALTVAGALMIASRIGPAVAQTYWDKFLVACHAAERQTADETQRALADDKTQQRWIDCLEHVVHWQPTHVEAHLKLAEAHRRLFDILQNASPNPMSVLQLSDAVFNEPKFRSREALAQWLPEAVGPHWVHLQQCLDHLKKALALCPLEGRGYIHLAEISFLWTADRSVGQACVEQAMRVRLYDGEVLYAAGNQALLAGNEALWRDYLSRAFLGGRPVQQRIMADRVAAAPPESLPAVIADMLAEFQPDLENARFLHALCEGRCTVEQMTALVQYRAEKAESEAASLDDAEQSAREWLEALELYHQLQDEAKAQQCAAEALERAPGMYAVHRHLGLYLLSQSQFAEAESHLRWCSQRMCNDRYVEASLREAFKGRLDQQRRDGKEVIR